MYILSNAFLQVLNMSITASIVLLVILLLRVPLKRAPRAISYVLWAVVLFRLVCPISFSSVFSFFGGFGQLDPQTNSRGNPAYVQPELIYLEPQAGAPGAAVPQLPASGMPAESMTEASLAQAAPLQTLVGIAAVVWVMGIAAMLAYGLVSQARLRRRVAAATPVSGNIYETDEIAMPFVMGALHPRIILPVGLPARERAHVLQHEEAHIARKDHVVKPLAFLLLCVHWFNPLLWLAFVLLGKDMELRCDERVIAACGEGERAAYSRTLLQLSTRSGLLPGSPLAFGETGLKARVRNILNYRKPAFWVGIVAAVAATIIAVSLLANPVQKGDTITLTRLELQEEELAEQSWLPGGEGSLAVAKYSLSALPESVYNLRLTCEEYDARGPRGGWGSDDLEIKPGETTLYVAQRMISNGTGGWRGADWAVQLEYADGSVAKAAFPAETSLLTYGKEQYDYAQDFLLGGGKRKLDITQAEAVPLALACMDTAQGVSGITCDALLKDSPNALTPGLHLVLQMELVAGTDKPAGDRLEEAAVNLYQVRGEIREYTDVRPLNLPLPRRGGQLAWQVNHAGNQLTLAEDTAWIATITYLPAAELPEAPALGTAGIYKQDEQGRLGAVLLLNEDFGCHVWSNVDRMSMDEFMNLLNSFSSFSVQLEYPARSTYLMDTLLAVPEGAQDLQEAYLDNRVLQLRFAYEGTAYELLASADESLHSYYTDSIYVRTLADSFSGGQYHTGRMDVQYNDSGACCVTFANAFAQYILRSENANPEAVQALSHSIANEIAKQYADSGAAKEDAWQGSIRLVKQGVPGRAWEIGQSDVEARLIDRVLFNAMVTSAAMPAPPLEKQDAYIEFTRTFSGERAEESGTYYAYVVDLRIPCLEMGGHCIRMDQSVYDILYALAEYGPKIPSLRELQAYRKPVQMLSDFISPQVVENELLFSPHDVLSAPLYLSTVWECDAGYFYIRQPDGSKLKLEPNADGEIITTNAQENGLGYYQPQVAVYWGMDDAEAATAPDTLEFRLTCYPMAKQPMQNGAGMNLPWEACYLMIRQESGGYALMEKEDVSRHLFPNAQC